MDPVRFEVIRRALDTASDEMCVAVARASYSTNIKSRLDLSCALLDRRGRVIGQSAAQPCHIAAMRQLSPALGLPVGYVYLAIPVGATVMTAQALLFALVPELRASDAEPGDTAAHERR